MGISAGNSIAAEDEIIGSGTGFAISSNYIVTCHHVVEDAASVSIKGIGGNFSREYSAKVVAKDARNDLAILRVNTPLGNVPYTLYRGTAAVGKDIFALGYPLTRIMGQKTKFTTGVISAQSGEKDDISQYQISAPITHGNSGGPLFDKKGHIVGVTSAGLSGEIAQNANYAIKSSYILNLIKNSNLRIALPRKSRLNGNPLTKQVKMAQKFVYLVVVRGENQSSKAQKFAEELYQKGIRDRNNELYQTALAYFKKAVEIAPMHEGALFELAKLYYKFDENSDAIYYYERVLSINDKNDVAFNNLAAIHYEIKNYSQAIRYYQKAVGIDPKYAVAWYNMGNAYKKLENYTQALRCYQKTLDINQNAAEVWNRMGLVYKEQKNYSQAIRYYQKAVEIDPKFAAAWFNIGDIYFSQGSYNQAISCFQKAVDIEPNFAVAWYNMGHAYKLQGNMTKAVQYIKNAAQLGDTDAQEWLREKGYS